MSDSFSLVEKYPQNKTALTSKICIRPYFDPDVENMGLEKYGLCLFDTIMQEEDLCCLESNGINRYVTGLNEFAPEVRALEPVARAAKIKDIRRTVAELEKMLASNVISDPENNPNFWNEVTLLRPDNDKLWSKIKLRCGNEPVYLQPETDAYDLIKLYAIEAGGFSIVAKSLEALKGMTSAPKFYLDKEIDTASVITEVKKLRNSAGKELEIMSSKSITKLIYVMKCLDLDSSQYRKSTPNDVIYNNADMYINGELSEKNKRQAAIKFVDMAKLDIETLKIKAIIKDANLFRFIVTKPDGIIYHVKTNQSLGRTVQDVLEYLKNPLQQAILTDLMNDVEVHWV